MKKLKREAFTTFIKKKAEQCINDFPQYANCTVSLMDMEKINGKKEGLLFKAQGAGIGPHMDVDKAYRNYLEADYSDEAWAISYVSAFLEKAVNVLTQGANAEQAIEAIKTSKLIPVLINKDFNKEYLKNYVYKDIPGTEFAVIVRAIVNITNDGIMSAVISNKMLETLEYTEDKLFELATSNLEVEVIPMSDIIMSAMMEDGMPEEMVDEMREALQRQAPWFVLTNKLKYYAPGAIIEPKVLSGICEKLGNFYIIPSSVHDLILIPEDIIDMKKPDLQMEEFIQSVNGDEKLIAKEEILSNKLYYYSKEEGLRLAFKE